MKKYRWNAISAKLVNRIFIKVRLNKIETSIQQEFC